MRTKYFLPVYIIVILAITIIMSFNPDYNWDMLPYMAILKKMDGVKSVDEVHKSCIY